MAHSFVYLTLRLMIPCRVKIKADDVPKLAIPCVDCSNCLFNNGFGEMMKSAGSALVAPPLKFLQT
jgi:hypothetical protein